MNNPEPMVRNRPSPDGAAIGESLARLTEHALVELRAKFPDHAEPCQSCAFRRGTVPNRCLTTVFDALKCVMEAKDFMCHQSPVNTHGCHTGLCVGWLIALSATQGRKPIETPWPFSHEEASEQTEHQVTPCNASNATCNEVKRGCRN